MRYWKADKKTSAAINAILSEWADVKEAAGKMARRVGASRNNFYTSKGFTQLYVSAFIFKDESKVDKKQFCRLKNTPDGWRPRRNTELGREFEKLSSNCVGKVMKLIGMDSFAPGAGGMVWNTPGFSQDDAGNVYITTPDYVNAKGCKRISDLQFERATKKGKK